MYHLLHLSPMPKKSIILLCNFVYYATDSVIARIKPIYFYIYDAVLLPVVIIIEMRLIRAIRMD